MLWNPNIFVPLRGTYERVVWIRSLSQNAIRAPFFHSASFPAEVALPEVLASENLVIRG